VRVADRFGLAIAGLGLAGVAAAAVRRRWRLLVLVPFQLAYVATYALFFAEPRYRLPIELLAFPFVALALGEVAAALRAGLQRSRPGLVHAAKALGPALLVVIVWRFAWPALLDAGTGLRARHRWAVSEAELDGRRRLLLWAAVPPLTAQSPLAGSPEGVHVRAREDGRPSALRLRLGGGPLPAGRYTLHFQLQAAAGSAHFALAGKEADVATGAPVPFDAPLDHPGGPLMLSAATAGDTLWIGEAALKNAH
jgi:hypothetical protein